MIIINHHLFLPVEAEDVVVSNIMVVITILLLTLITLIRVKAYRNLMSI